MEIVKIWKLRLRQNLWLPRELSRCPNSRFWVCNVELFLKNASQELPLNPKPPVCNQSTHFQFKDIIMRSSSFLPFPQRLLCILQLCIGFSTLLWFLFQPFMGEYYSIRSRMLVYEYGMGTSEILKKEAPEVLKAKSYRLWFEELPSSKKERIKKDYEQLEQHLHRSFFEKLQGGFSRFFFEMSIFKIFWILFSIILPILLLLKVEGALTAVWILPLLTLCFIVDNLLYAPSTKEAPDASLFPSEEVLLSDYLKTPLTGSLFNQKEQLEKGWQMYLIDRWGSKEASHEEKAEFFFTLERLERFHSQKPEEIPGHLNQKISLLQIFLFLSWNLYFAWSMQKIGKKPSFGFKEMMPVPRENL